MAYLNATRSARPGLLDRLVALATQIREAARRRAIYRQTLRELNALTNRELTDLGLNRTMLTRVAMEAAYGK